MGKIAHFIGEMDVVGRYAQNYKKINSKNFKLRKTTC